MSSNATMALVRFHSAASSTHGGEDNVWAANEQRLRRSWCCGATQLRSERLLGPPEASGCLSKTSDGSLEASRSLTFAQSKRQVASVSQKTLPLRPVEAPVSKFSPQSKRQVASVSQKTLSLRPVEAPVSKCFPQRERTFSALSLTALILCRAGAPRCPLRLLAGKAPLPEPLKPRFAAPLSSPPNKSTAPGRL